MVKLVASLDVDWPIRRRRGSQNNFTDEFSPDVAVWNKSKMAAMGNTLCIIRYRIFIFIMGKKKNTMPGACV